MACPAEPRRRPRLAPGYWFSLHDYTEIGRARLEAARPSPSRFYVLKFVDIPPMEMI